MEQHDVLLVFVKSAVKGRVKTRLAQAIGEERALEVYERLLLITAEAAQGVNALRDVHLEGEEMPECFRDEKVFTPFAQATGDLGERMSAAFAKSFDAGAQRVVIIGSDLPTITAQRMAEAFTTLATHDAVIGPTTDGGYYLLGLRSRIPGLFTSMPWSTPDLLRSTLAYLDVHAYTYRLLPEECDIDTGDDLLAHGW